jgi:hypothetical protein
LAGFARHTYYARVKILLYKKSPEGLLFFTSYGVFV